MKKVIIWGHPLHSHTHSYVHEGYYKALKFLGYNVSWFHDNNFPKDFDYNNSIFITEGFADKNIPLNETSTYCVMYCPSPKRYLEAGVKKYIDLRMIAVGHKDHVQEYTLNKSIVEKIGPSYYYDASTKKTIRYRNDYVDYDIEDFDKVYFSWATNLLPHEINNSNAYLDRKPEIYYFGTLSPHGECENMSTFLPFIQATKKLGIPFLHNDPWKNPVDSEVLMKYTQQSLLGIDIRGPKHLQTGIVTCRVAKNISYGHLGLTNSKAIYEELEGNCVYNSDTEQLLYEGLRKSHDFLFIKNSMNYIKENHTYINRINSLFSIL